MLQHRVIISFLSKVAAEQPKPAFTCSKITIETLEQDVKYVQSLQ